VRSATIHVHDIDRHEVLRGHSVGIVQILVRYLAKLLRLQLWHLHWLESVQSVNSLHSLEA
jgi:hypothetical protein